jgi:hypothetical protein
MSPQDQQEFDQAGAPFGITGKGGSANNLMRKAAAMAPMLRNSLIGGAGAATAAGLGTMFAGKEDEEGQEGPSRAQRAIRNALLAGSAGVAGGAGLTAAGFFDGSDPATTKLPEGGSFSKKPPGPNEGPLRWVPPENEMMSDVDGGVYEGANLGHGATDVIAPNKAIGATSLEGAREDVGRRTIESVGGEEALLKLTPEQQRQALMNAPDDPSVLDAYRYYSRQPAAQGEATAIFNPNAEMAGGGEYRSRRQAEMDVAIRKRKAAAAARKRQRELEASLSDGVAHPTH